jgi:hypothetical protein
MATNKYAGNNDKFGDEDHKCGDANNKCGDNDDDSFSQPIQQIMVSCLLDFSDLATRRKQAKFRRDQQAKY